MGPDVDNNGTTLHTLWIANDNDFLQDLNGPGTNPNQFFVFGFTDTDLNGSKFVAEQAQGSAKTEQKPVCVVRSIDGKPEAQIARVRVRARAISFGRSKAGGELKSGRYGMVIAWWRSMW